MKVEDFEKNYTHWTIHLFWTHTCLKVKKSKSYILESYLSQF